jgi:mannose-6-phosphate isomerase-like protein (cupin superfamily)
MADVTVKRLEEFEAVFGGGMRRVRAGLGVTSFGIQVIELPPNFFLYPAHDHSHDEQEEVYLALGGRATLQVGEEQFELEPGVFARVGPGQQRKLLTDSEGARILCLGAMPGKVYEAPEWTEEGGSLPPMPEKEAAHAAQPNGSPGAAA